MAELDLNFERLEKIFDLDFSDHSLRLKPADDGTLRTSMNVQEFYRWYRHKQMDFMWANNFLDSGGFIGLQPIVKLKSGFKFHVPKVSKFFIHGLLVTELPGEYPFVVDSQTELTMSHYSRPHAHVFLSHSSVDKPFVRELREQLYSICDTFFDETDIQPGQSITKRLNEGLVRSSLLVLLHSQHSLASDWVQREWASMLHLAKPLVLVRLDDAPVPPLLMDLKYIEGRSSPATVASGIAAAIGAVDI